MPAKMAKDPAGEESTVSGETACRAVLDFCVNLGRYGSRVWLWTTVCGVYCGWWCDILDNGVDWKAWKLSGRRMSSSSRAPHVVFTADFMMNEWMNEWTWMNSIGQMICCRSMYRSSRRFVVDESVNSWLWRFPKGNLFFCCCDPSVSSWKKYGIVALYCLFPRAWTERWVARFHHPRKHRLTVSSFVAKMRLRIGRVLVSNRKNRNARAKDSLDSLSI